MPQVPDLARARQRAEQQRDTEQEHHQAVGLELERAGRGQRVDADRHEPDDRDEADERERARRRFDRLGRARERDADGGRDGGRGRREPRRPRSQQQPERAGACEGRAARRDRRAAERQRGEQGDETDERQRERERAPARLARRAGAQVACGGAHVRRLTGVVGGRCDARGRGATPARSRRAALGSALARARGGLRSIAVGRLLDLRPERHRRHLERRELGLGGARSRGARRRRPRAGPAGRRAPRRRAGRRLRGAGSAARGRARSRPLRAARGTRRRRRAAAWRRRSRSPTRRC